MTTAIYTPTTKRLQRIADRRFGWMRVAPVVEFHPEVNSVLRYLLRWYDGDKMRITPLGRTAPAARLQLRDLSIGETV